MPSGTAALDTGREPIQTAEAHLVGENAPQTPAQRFERRRVELAVSENIDDLVVTGS